MLTLDSSGLLALLDPRERRHRAAVKTLKSHGGPFLVPAGILGEVTYMVLTRLGPAALDRVVADLEARAFATDCGEEDYPRIRELIARYDDLPLGFADAAVVACAERNGGAVLAYDRDFDVVAAEGTIRVVGG